METEVCVHLKILTAAGAFLVGAALAFLNYFLMKKLCTGDYAKYWRLSRLRSIIDIAFLLALFMLGQKTDLGLTELLLGGALGITLPSLYFTPKLLKSVSSDKSDEEKEDDD